MLNELNVVKQDFHIDKKFLREDFFYGNNTKKYYVFKFLLENRSVIQEEFYNYLQKQKVQVLFFNWFDDYTSKNNIYFPFFYNIE